MKKFIIFFLMIGILFSSSCSYIANKRWVKLVDEAVLAIEAHVPYDQTIIKYHTVKGEGWVVIKNETTGNYWAANLSEFSANMSYQDLLDVFKNMAINNGENIYYDGESLIDLGDGTYKANIILYYVANTGNFTIRNVSGEPGWIFDNTEQTLKDLEKIGTILEDQRNQNLGNWISGEYLLSEERGLKIAKMVSNWKKIGNRREITKRDSNAFMKEMVGFGPELLTEAMYGDENAKEDLIERAAEVNGTSPEVIKEILSNFVLD